VLSQLLGSRLREKLLGWLLSHPGESFYIRELERLIAEDPTNISRELRRLERMGIVESERKANAKYYAINEACPIYDELRGLFRKTVGAASEIRQALESIEGIEAAFIYGSVARGEERAGSDIDLFLVGKLDENELLPRIREAEDTLGREVNYTIYSTKEFKERKKRHDPFISTVLEEPIVPVIGSPHDL